MSDTRDIRIKYSADERGAVSAFQRLRLEVVNNQKTLEKVGQQGRVTGTALKDMADVLGPQFQILGDRIDHVAGSLADVKGASLLTKASLVGLVSVASFQVGDMIANWAMQTEAWKKAHEDAVKSITESSRFVNGLTQDRFQKQIEIAELASSREQRNAELSTLRAQKLNELSQARNELVEREKELNVALGNDILGYGKEDNALAEENVRLAKERVKLLNEQFNAVDKLRYREGPTGLDAELQKRRKASEDAAQTARDAAKAEATRTAELAKQEAEIERLNNAQTDYLSSLELELIRVRDGSEAYERARLARMEYSDETIERAMDLRREIERLREAERGDGNGNIAGGGGRMDGPGVVQATQQRFITRGGGIDKQDKLLALQEAALEKDAQTLEELREQNRILRERLPGVTF